MAAWINEFHYDNTGTDAGEFVEVVLSPGTAAAGYSIVLYNGSNPAAGVTYGTAQLLTGAAATTTDLGNGYTAVRIAYPVDGLQNGTADGIALVQSGTTVVEFISYEGGLVASNGPAAGMTATTITPSETGSALNTSIARVGSGDEGSDFTWQLATTATPGAVNTGQTLTGGTPVSTPVVSVTASDASATEGTADTGVTFTFTRTGDLTQALTVDYTPGGTAAAGDFTPAVGSSITFAAGSATAALTLSIVNDTEVEARETVTVSLVDGAAYNLGANATAEAGLLSDDARAVKISEVQGAGAASPIAGQLVSIEAIVVGDFQNGDADNGRNIGGFFVQEEGADWDSNALTSEGVFVFGGTTDVKVGDKVQVFGTVTEYFGLTEISATRIDVVQAGAVANVSSMAVNVSLPGSLEAYEGMLVKIPQTLVVTELQDLERLGETKLYAAEGDGMAGQVDEGPDGRPYTYTQTNDPSVAGFAAHEAAIAARSIILDDGLNGTWQGIQNPAGGAYGTATALQSGDSIQNLTGVLDYGFDFFRVRSVADGQNTFTDTNPRDPTPPDVGGSLTVGSFNVLNYFVTLDNGGLTDIGMQPRGANTDFEFARQTAKLVDTIITLDADVLALVELENDFSKPASPEFLTGGPAVRAALYLAEGNAIGYLVEKLNEASGDDVYAWVDPGSNFVGTDAISVGFIYKKDVVQIAEGTVVAVDMDAVNNRPTVAVTFEEIATAGEFTAVANHLKSKGSGTGVNADQHDGQSASNADRVLQAERLVEWLGGDPTHTTDADYLLLGDFNSYYQEDPIDVLREGGFDPLFNAQTASYVFDGQPGTLDYALANGTLGDQVTGEGHWNISADEAPALDYNVSVTGAPAAYARPTAWFNGDVPYRVSDHDAMVVGLDLTPSNQTIDGTADPDLLVGKGGNDTINGGAGNDTIDGAGGNDLLDGGVGFDILRGGAGNDVFKVSPEPAGSARFGRHDLAIDVIVDFKTGEDKLLFTDAKVVKIQTVGNVNAAENVLGQDLDGLAKQADPKMSVTLVYGDWNDDGKADFAVALMGVNGLTASDWAA